MEGLDENAKQESDELSDVDSKAESNEDLDDLVLDQQPARVDSAEKRCEPHHDGEREALQLREQKHPQPHLDDETADRDAFFWCRGLLGAQGLVVCAQM